MERKTSIAKAEGLGGRNSGNYILVLLLDRKRRETPTIGPPNDLLASVQPHRQLATSPSIVLDNKDDLKRYSTRSWFTNYCSFTIQKKKENKRILDLLATTERRRSS